MHPVHPILQMVKNLKIFPLTKEVERTGGRAKLIYADFYYQKQRRLLPLKSGELRLYIQDGGCKEVEFKERFWMFI